MVKIRYTELPVGLHVIAEADGRDTTVYLLPGLTAAQRRAALVRIRNTARMGKGPALPAFGFARALAADRVRMTARTGARAMLVHPLLLAPAVVLVSGAVAVVFLSFATVIRVPAGDTGRAPAGSASTAGHRGPQQYGLTGLLPAQQDSRRDKRAAHRSGTGHARRARGSAANAPAASARPAGSPSPVRWSAPVSPWPGPSPSRTCVRLGPLGKCPRV